MRHYFNYKTLGMLVVIGIILFGIKSVLSTDKNQKSNSDQKEPFVESAKVKSETSKSEPKNLPNVSDQNQASQDLITQDINVPILMYHHIAYYYGNKDDALASLYIFPESFEKQMAYLKLAGYNVISLDRLYQGLKGLTKLPEKPVVITFDDGYDDNYQFAYPILKKYDMTATFFIITGKVGTSTYMNWRQIRYLSKNGFTLGAHTVNHENLANISTSLAEKEISKSKEDLEYALDKKVRFFSYPFGDYNLNLNSDLEQNNFLAAVTTVGGKVTNNSQMFKLPRKRVDGKYFGLYGIDHFISLLK